MKTASTAKKLMVTAKKQVTQKKKKRYDYQITFVPHKKGYVLPKFKQRSIRDCIPYYAASETIRMVDLTSEHDSFLEEDKFVVNS